MCFGNDLFQALLDSFWRRLVRKCGRGQREHCGNRLAQVVGSLLDGACAFAVHRPDFPGRSAQSRLPDLLSPCHVPHPK